MSLPHLADFQFHQTRHHNSINLLLDETILFTSFPNVAERNPRPLPLPATFAHSAWGELLSNPIILTAEVLGEIHSSFGLVATHGYLADCFLFRVLRNSRSPLRDFHLHFFVLPARAEGLSSLWVISTDHPPIKTL